MKEHISEEMFANVSIDQVKRAKKIVMKRWLDSTKGQYTRLHDYREELIQSNPGSTVVIKQDHSVEEPTFQRIA